MALVELVVRKRLPRSLSPHRDGSQSASCAPWTSATNWRCGSLMRPCISVTTGQGHADEQIRQSPPGRPGWLQQHGTRLPQQLRTLIDHENKAVTIDHFEATLVPGLLQTTDYARALIRQAGLIPTGEIEDRVAARLGRQSLFGRERPARFTFFIHEFVLRLPVGGPTVMVE